MADAHTDRAQHVQWLGDSRLVSGGAVSGAASAKVGLLMSAQDNLVKVWNCAAPPPGVPRVEHTVESKHALVAELRGHTARVNRCVCVCVCVCVFVCCIPRCC